MKKKTPHLFLVLALLLVPAFTPSHALATNPASAIFQQPGPLNFVFAEGTDVDYVEQVYSNLSSELGIGFFNTEAHWNPSQTATNDGTSSAQGESLTLTYSFIPDGTFMPAQFFQDTNCNSNLQSSLDAVYGPGVWQAQITTVFANEWGAKSGNQYLFEPNDDGATWPYAPGVLGVRGDIRIGGCAIDGNFGILAYNFFPNLGDMKIEVTDSFFHAGNLTTGFHNVFSHEHGHGAGIEHVCPINQTKLMEPFITTAFIGMQHDDIRAAQRHYGDYNEVIGALGNDTSDQPTDLGTPADNNPVSVPEVSIDDNGDQDFYRFTVGANKQIDVTVSPVGSTYLDGPQNPDGTCSAGTPTNSLAVHDLGFELIDSNGTTVLTSVNANGAGLGETLANYPLGAAGNKFIRVYGDNTNDVQLYDLAFTVVASAVGTIIVEKQTHPGGSTQSFEFFTDYGPSFSLTDDETNNSGPLTPGTYSVSEITIPAEWGLISAICDDGSDPSAVGLNAGETVTCVFTNASVPIYVSSSSNGAAGGVSFADEDIVSYAPGSGSWSMVFDGSDVGVDVTDVDGFLLLSDGGILMSFEAEVDLPGLGVVDDSDIVHFSPTSTGPSTAGSFSLFFDGSDVGLGSNGEDIDAIGVSPDGRLLISTRGSFGIPGVSGTNEDLLFFTATSFGSVTSGVFGLYFDGSDVDLGAKDVESAWVDPATGEIYLSLNTAFALPGVSGDKADVFICDPGSTGPNTSCTYGHFWDGSANGFGGELIDGVSVGGGVQPVAVSDGIVAVSSSTGGNAGGIWFADEDIVAYDAASGTWSMFFDGSDVGLNGSWTMDVDAFHIRPDGSILLSVVGPSTLPDAGSVDDSDIVHFVPTSLGPTTAGTFSLYFDGSDVDLTTNGEDVDGIYEMANGDLVLSTASGYSVSDATGADEDLIRFSPTSLGSTTSGTWAPYFDGSDVGLNNSIYEDVWGTWIDETTGQVYLTTLDTFSVSGVSGDGADIFICDPGSLGATTSCTFSPFWDGSANGFGGERVDGMFIVP